MSAFPFVHGYSFSEPVHEVAAYSVDQVVPALARVEELVAGGLHAAGLISYEAAPGLDAALSTRAPSPFPLLWFGLYRNRSAAAAPECGESYRTGDWEATVTEEGHAAAIRKIRQYIAAGDCYQVNYTVREHFLCSGSALAYFNDLMCAQATPFAGYLEVGHFRILSASPELFFALKEGILTCRPMKGTATRGRWPEEDEEAKRVLTESPKERAENLMIVDLLRNDMGRVSVTGSVSVTSLFEVETLPTVHQMTSTITSRLRPGVGVVELFRALFPCGSITGAPKRRSMEIIAEVEDSPRSLYTGCIGYISPGGEAQFSVAIRTAVIDSLTGRGELGIGSGVTYDSVALSEYAECLAKARFAREKPPEFHLIESLLFEDGYFLMERHLARLSRSAAYFGFPVEPSAVRARLTEVGAGLAGRHKVRLLLYRDGTLSCESAPIPPAGEGARAVFAPAAVDSADPFLYHKTSWRPLYQRELSAHPECDEVIFVNERGEVTEGGNNNIVALVDGELVTPALSCGLLGGVFREELLQRGEIREGVLTKEDLKRAQEVYLINSVRKWRRITLV